MNMKINSGTNLVGELPIRGGEMISLELQTLAGTMKFGKVSKEEGIEPVQESYMFMRSKI